MKTRYIRLHRLIQNGKLTKLFYKLRDQGYNLKEIDVFYPINWHETKIPRLEIVHKSEL